MARPAVYALALALIASVSAEDCAHGACAAGSEEEAAAMLQLKSSGETSPPSGGQQVGQECGACPGTGFTYPSCAPGLVCVSPANNGIGGCPKCQRPSTPAPTTAGSQQLGQKCGPCAGTGFTYPSCATGLVCKSPPAANGVGGCPTCQSPPSGKEGDQCGLNTPTDCEAGLYCMMPPASHPGIGAYGTCVRKCGTVPSTVNGACGPGKTCKCNTMPCKSFEENCFLYCC